MKNPRKTNRKMPGAVALMVMLLMLAACALAEDAKTTPAVGPAVAAPQARTERVPLYAQADESSDVLMSYFSGAQLEVVALAENGLVQVRCGTLEGYMREGDLRYGARAMRAVRPVTVSLELAQTEHIRTEWGDESALTFDETMYAEVWGMSGEWAQTCGRPVYLVGTWAGQDMERGFLPIAGGVVSTEYTEYAVVSVVPLEDELTFEQAYERGIELALENADQLIRIPKELRTSQGLHALEADLFLTYNFDSESAVWCAYYSDDEDIDINFAVTMDPYGEMIEIQATNG